MNRTNTMSLKDRRIHKPANGQKPANKKKASRKLDGHEMTLLTYKRNLQPITIFALEGGDKTQFTGIVTDFDRFSVTLQLSEDPSDFILLFKHAIQGFSPAKSL